jgi:predicted house-cleaning NTP pyrophosphatase (Maf/HAM1 superfamily)
MSAITEQLLERIGAELRDIRHSLDSLRAEFPEHPTIQQATELYDELNGRLADAKARAARNELSEDDVVALSETISAGMKKMVSLVASDDKEEGRRKH